MTGLEKLKAASAYIRKHLLVFASLGGGLFYLLYRRESGKRAEAEAKSIAAEKRGEAGELARETKVAEEMARDSRQTYEELKKQYED